MQHPWDAIFCWSTWAKEVTKSPMFTGPHAHVMLICSPEMCCRHSKIWKSTNKTDWNLCLCEWAKTFVVVWPKHVHQPLINRCHVLASCQFLVACTKASDQHTPIHPENIAAFLPASVWHMSNLTSRTKNNTQVLVVAFWGQKQIWNRPGLRLDKSFGVWPTSSLDMNQEDMRHNVNWHTTRSDDIPFPADN